MDRTATKLLIALLLFVSTETQAALKFSVGGVQSFTDHRRLSTPNGYDVFVQQSLGRSLSLRFDYARVTDKQSYEAVYYRNLPPGAEDQVYDLWNTSSTMQSGELAVMIRALDRPPLQLHLGIGLAYFNLRSRSEGVNTGIVDADSPQEKLALGLSVDLALRPAPLAPLGFDLVARQRFGNSEFMAFDGYSTFDDALSSTEFIFCVSVVI